MSEESEPMTKAKVSKGDNLVEIKTTRTRPSLTIKSCRGRSGGTALLLAIAQRARWAGRDVILIDGDESSKTLRMYYPADRPGAALVPNGTDAVAFKDL